LLIKGFASVDSVDGERELVVQVGRPLTPAGPLGRDGVLPWRGELRDSIPAVALAETLRELSTAGLFARVLARTRPPRGTHRNAEPFAE
jgi:hypothetical protein